MFRAYGYDSDWISLHDAASRLPTWAYNMGPTERKLLASTVDAFLHDMQTGTKRWFRNAMGGEGNGDSYFMESRPTCANAGITTTARTSYPPA